MMNRVDRLEEAGLVARRADPADRRGVLGQVTKEVLTIADQAIMATLEKEAELLRELTPGKRQP